MSIASGRPEKANPLSVGLLGNRQAVAGSVARQYGQAPADPAQP